MEIRPYDPDRDRDDVWDLKRSFELELGADTGDEVKRTIYEAKLTGGYRDRYFEWVDRCVEADERCVTVADADDELWGYVFVLPERLAMIWDAAVLNEIYVREEHRGTGTADALMEAALALARDQSLPIDRIVLDVDRENERAARFYERHGFDHWGEMIAREL